MVPPSASQGSRKRCETVVSIRSKWPSLQVAFLQFMEMEVLEMFLTFEVLLAGPAFRICCRSRSHLALCRWPPGGSVPK